MSGPKNFSIRYVNAPAAEIRRHNEAFRRSREAHVREKLSLARQRFSTDFAEEMAEQQAIVNAHLAECAERNRAALSRATTDAQKPTPTVEPVPTPRANKAPGPSVVDDTPAPPAAIATPAAPPQAQHSLQAKSAFLKGWIQALADDTAVRTFANSQQEEWHGRAESLVNSAPAEFETLADRLASEAQLLHAHAGEMQLQFDARNRLLTDVIQSMKEIGYFVSDPYFADPSNPGSSVILKAVCGSQVVTTSVDLSSMVKSVWDGQEHEGCKDVFFNYVDAMKSRGVEVEPERSDLRERPVLKQKGANELPRSSDGSNRLGG
jgi:hypothetical protein